MDPNFTTAFIQTPLTDLVPYIGGNVDLDDLTPFCRKLYHNYYTCMEAYGVYKGKIKCADIYEDMIECTYGFKQVWRYHKIQEERKRQKKLGKIKDENPVIDGFVNM